MATSWLGPAPSRRGAAPAHRGSARYRSLATLTSAAALTLGCNLGHSEPTLAVDTDGTEPALTPPSHSPETDASASVPDAGPTSSPANSDATTPCENGAFRCAGDGSAAREKCVAGHWVNGPACSKGDVCQYLNATTTNCVTPPDNCEAGDCETPCEGDGIACEYLEGAADVVVSCVNGRLRRASCLDATPHCVNAEGCKACSQNAHCDDEATTCHEFVCNDAFTCESVQADEGDTCADGVCNAAGECVDCNKSADCGDPATCREWSCDHGTCVEGLVNERSSCASDAGGLCNLSGDCVACLEDNDCSDVEVDACYRPKCGASGQCEPTPLDVGTECGTELTNVCDGAGQCVECVTKEHCNNDYVCRDAACQNPFVDLGWRDNLQGSAMVYNDSVYLRRLDPLTYPATLMGFGAVAAVVDNDTAIEFALFEDDGTGAWPSGSAIAEVHVNAIPTVYETTPPAQTPTLATGKYYWLGFRVDADVSLRLSDSQEVTYAAGRRVTDDNEIPFYVPDPGDAPGGESTDPYAVFALIKYLE